MNMKRRCAYDPIMPRRMSISRSLSRRLSPRLPEAASEFRAALRFDPESAKVHSNLGVVLAQMPGHLPEAISEFEAAFRVSGDPMQLRQAEQLRSGSKQKAVIAKTPRGVPLNCTVVA